MANLKYWLAGGAILGLAGMNGMLMWRSSQMEAELTRVKATTASDLQTLRQSAAATMQATTKTIEELNHQLSESNTKANALANVAKINAQRHAEKLVANLAEQQKAAEERRNEIAVKVDQAERAIGEVKQAAETNQGKIQEVASEVTSVKTDVATAKSTLESTIADLKSVKGDLGVQSGLIATNSKELAALRELGERNYFEFTLNKSKNAIKVGTIMLALKKTDLKRNKFNLDVMADDRRVEKKDKTINEPVQFYVSGSRQPYEIVVNRIDKDKVTGYLATPKVLTARR